jgi:putative oxidoreductase
MERFLGRYAPQLFAIFRIVAGLMFAMHGTQKLFGWPGDRPRATAMPQLIAGVIEVVAGPLIAIGLFASPLAFLASGLMAVAYFWRHSPDGFWPIVNRGELAVVYCFLFLYIAANGPGVWSVGGKRRTGGAPARL